MNIELQSRALRRLASHLVTDDVAADDLVQDVWVDAIRNPPHGGAPSGPWLRTVLRNRRVTNLRSDERRARREQHADPPIPPPSAERIQIARELLEHLAALPEDDRDLLTLRYWEALTLQECAERLGLPPSTARSRHSRALRRLRARLDERTGGRSAWLTALAPWCTVAPRTAKPAGGGLGLASISGGGVAASGLLWLLVATDPGCNTDLAATAPSDGAEARLTTAAAISSPATTPGLRGAGPAGSSSASVPDDRDPDKHPCEMPISAEDAPSMADRITTGAKLDRDEFTKAYLECVGRHGPPSDYTSPQEDGGGKTHPLLSTSMAMQHVWPTTRDCYDEDEPARARVSYVFRMHGDGEITIGDVVVEASENLDPDQRTCVADSFSVAAIDLRPGDPTLLGLEPGTEIVMPRVIGLELRADRSPEVYAGGRQPPQNLALRDTARFAAGLEACKAAPVVARMHWDPETKELLEVRVASDDAGRCLESLFESELEPLRLGFFPRTDADTWQTCSWTKDQETAKFECSHDPLFQVVEG